MLTTSFTLQPKSCDELNVRSYASDLNLLTERIYRLEFGYTAPNIAAWAYVAVIVRDVSRLRELADRINTAVTALEQAEAARIADATTAADLPKVQVEP